MRKNSPRKWLHACLDLLPVILIPVFMIYSHRHTIDNYSISIDTTYQFHVDNIAFDKSFNNTYITHNANSNTISVSGSNSIQNISFSSLFNDSDSSFLNNRYLIYKKTNLLKDVNIQIRDHIGILNFNTLLTLDNNLNCVPFTFPSSVTSLSLDFIPVDSSNSSYSFDVVFVPCSNLTDDEISIVLENSTLSYGVHNLTGGSNTIYDDTDIGSQFFYCLYNSVDKYFNMGNVFGLNGVYQWFNTNIFGGNAPLSVYVVWNIALYELVMDLLFLLYGLFMWFIDMVQYLMEKPFKSIK